MTSEVSSEPRAYTIALDDELLFSLGEKAVTSMAKMMEHAARYRLQILRAEHFCTGGHTRNPAFVDNPKESEQFPYNECLICGQFERKDGAD